MDACLSTRSEIAREIVLYLASHPDTEDTADGIANRWLSGVKTAPSPALLKEVLADLVTQGLVEARQENDGTVRYRPRKRSGGRSNGRN